MHITLESDYAIRIVSCMVESKNRLDAKTIAEKTNVPQRFALKILRKLVASDIIVSYKGASGGYELAKAPKEITLLDVIETVEGTYYFSRCLNNEYDCSCVDRTLCKTKHIFADITEQVQRRLKETNFEMLSQAAQS